MNDVPPILIVITALLAALALCVVLAGVMHCCAKPEPKPDFGFKIPQDREFTDPLDDGYTPCTPLLTVGRVAPRAPLWNVGSTDPVALPAQGIPSPVFGRYESATFPQDDSYQREPNRF